MLIYFNLNLQCNSALIINLKLLITKKITFFICLLTLLLLTFSCSKEELSDNNSQNYTSSVNENSFDLISGNSLEDISINSIGTEHNDGLDYILQKLIVANSENSFTVNDRDEIFSIV